MPATVTLYQLSYCPYCKKVREVLEELDIPYEPVDVPADRDEREELFDVSDQRLVPVLVYNGRVLADSDEIIDFLRDLD